MLEFHGAMRAAQASQPACGPPIIHCSAGVGRSGTYIAIDRLLEAIHDCGKGDGVSVLAVVSDLRRARNLMVQTQLQYVFIYKFLADYLEREASILRKAESAAAAAAPPETHEIQPANTHDEAPSSSAPADSGREGAAAAEPAGGDQGMSFMQKLAHVDMFCMKHV